MTKPTLRAAEHPDFPSGCYELKCEYRSAIPSLCREHRGRWYKEELVWRLPSTINSVQFMSQIETLLRGPVGPRRGGKNTRRQDKEGLLVEIGNLRQRIAAEEERITELERLVHKLA